MCVETVVHFMVEDLSATKIEKTKILSTKFASYGYGFFVGKYGVAQLIFYEANVRFIYIFDLSTCELNGGDPSS